MTLKILMIAGGLLALAVAGVAARFRRPRSGDIRTEQVSGDWLAQARAPEEHQW